MRSRWSRVAGIVVGGALLAPRAGLASSTIEDLLARRLAQKQAQRVGSQVPEEAPDVEAIPELSTEPLPGTRTDLPLGHVRVPKAIKLTLDALPEKLVESQESKATDLAAYALVGHKIETSVSFLPGGQMKQNSAESFEALGVFLSQPARRISSFSVRVLAFKDAKKLWTIGKTPPAGKLEIVRVREVGDVRGHSEKTIEGISFNVGGWTKVPVDFDADPRYRYLFILSVPSEKDEAWVTVPASARGIFPVLQLNPKNNVPLRAGQKRFDASVAFEFKPDPTALLPTAKVEGDFLAHLRRFLEERPGQTTVPLRLVIE